jgi:urea carboxylase
VDIDGGTAFVCGKTFTVEANKANPLPPATSGQQEVKLLSQADGVVYQVKARVGQKVSAGDTLMVLESMKMEMAVKVPQDGVIREISVKVGNPVISGQLIAVLAVN